jgi:hypothetical protein
MVLCTDDKDNHIDLFLTSEYCGRFERVHVQTGGIDERDIHDAVAEESVVLAGFAHVDFDRGVDIRLVDEVLKIIDGEYVIRRFITSIVLLSVFDRMDLFDIIIERDIEDLAKETRARLLILGKNSATNQGIAKCTLSGVEVACDENLGRRIFQTIFERVEMFEGLNELRADEGGHGFTFEVGQVGMPRGTDTEINFQHSGHVLTGVHKVGLRDVIFGQRLAGGNVVLSGKGATDSRPRGRSHGRVWQAFSPISHQWPS